MKKVVSLLLVLALVFSIVACGTANNETEKAIVEPTETETVAPTTVPPTTTTATTATTATPTTTTPTTTAETESLDEQPYLQSLDSEMYKGDLYVDGEWEKGMCDHYIADKARTMEMTEEEFYNFAKIHVMASLFGMTSGSGLDNSWLVIDFADGTGIVFTTMDFGYGVYGKINPDCLLAEELFGLIRYEDGEVWYEAKE